MAASFLKLSCVVTSLMFTRFLMFSIVLPNTLLFINLKKSFSKSLAVFARNNVFKSMYFFSHGLSSNLMPLCTLVVFNPRLSYSFKFSQWITYFVFCTSLVLAYRLCLLLSFRELVGSHCAGHEDLRVFHVNL